MTKASTDYLVTSLALVLILTSLPSALCQNGTVCGSGTCNSNQFCFQGTQLLCINCNVACNGCRGPGNDECNSCNTGFQAVGSACTKCPEGRFGDYCSGICHCLNQVCDSVTGYCSGKCEKGYYKPPECQEACPDLKYGLDCDSVCHCYNNSVCDKALGFCPNNLCHPDYTGVGCSNQMPKLKFAPTVSTVTCAYVTVSWPVWTQISGDGDSSLPIYDYRLYWRQNGTTSSWTRFVTLLHNPSVTTYSSNVTGLPGDRYYQFRVDVHYTNDGKVVDTASPGIATLPPVFVLCTTTTTAPPVTVPIIVGSDIFDSLTASNEPNGSVLITWSIAPKLLNYQWNITLAYRVLGTGDCTLENLSSFTYVPLSQNTSSYRIASSPGWTRYQVVLTAQGQGSISTANGNKTVTRVTEDIQPSGNVTDLRAEELQATAVTLWWTDVPCEQRGGVLRHYDVMLRRLDAGWTLNVTSNLTSIRVEGLTPYTSYSATVRYVNSVGPGPFGPACAFDTSEAAPAAVNITALVPAQFRITVNVTSPVPANGLILDYDINYSTDPAFNLTQSVTLTFHSPLTYPPVLGGLSHNTAYYVRARARTSAGYGPYGGVVQTRTLPATATAPPTVLQNGRNVSCVAVTWSAPQSSPLPVTGYRVVLVKHGDGNQGDIDTLSANVTTFSKCSLQAASAYTLTVTSLSAGQVEGETVTLTLTTELPTPPTPTAPVLDNISTTNATVILEPVAAAGVEAYILKVQVLAANGTRKKRSAAVPGYETAVLGPGQVTGGTLFTVGDGLPYGGATNLPLEPGRRYLLHYLVRATANNETKYSSVTMDQPFTTLLPTPPTTPPPATTTATNIATTITTTTTTTTAPVVAAASSDNNGVLLGILLALLFVIIVIILVIVFVICWRRRRALKAPPPYVELGERVKPDPPKARPEPYVPERYWNRIASTRESRYIVVGRECLPDDLLPPVDSRGQHVPEDKAVTFRDEFKTLPHQFNQTTTREASLHPTRNRFPHLLAYDHTRVPLQPDSSSSATYINASWLSGYRRSQRYVAAQSPYNDQTAVDMWRLIHQYRVKTVVLIANIVEDDIVKCTQFWPQDGQNLVTIGHFCLELREEMVYADFVVRDIAVRASRDKHERIVRLFEFTSWPDHGVPDDPIPFLDLRHKVRQYHGDDPGPIVVHCGTGVARTGVFIAVDSLIDQYAVEGRISVFSFVRNMRKERTNMVRTYKQYAFIYECVLEFFQAGKTMVDSGTLKTKFHEWIAKNHKTDHSFLRDQFELLQRLSRGPTPDQCLTATLPDNVKRNRYCDVIPSDQHRPRLISPSSLSKTDYINAIFVDGYRKRNQFILTQDPLHTTVGDFWRLVYDHRVTTIVMMDAYRHRDDTVAQYWLTDGLVLKQWEPFFVELTAAFQQDNVTIRNLKLVNTQFPSQPHLVRQFQFNAWSENSFTPVSKTMALDLLELAMDHHRSSELPETPILVHCEDGATHSGLWLTLALMCERMDEEEEVDVYHVVKHVKRRRPQVLSDYNQYKFLYKTLWDYVNLRMPGGTFTDTLGQSVTDRVYGSASLTLTARPDNLY